MPVQISILFAAVVLFLPAYASAQSAEEVLSKVDAVAEKADDFTAKVRVVTNESNGKKTEREMTVWQKGLGARMLKLSAPARLEGVAMLATDADQHYMYLPSFKRVRRISGQRRGEPFLGSNFTQDDMVRTGYAKRFNAALVAQDDDSWTLELTPKNAKKEPSHHLVVTVRKADHLVAKVVAYDGPKEATREIVASEVKVVGELPIATKIVAKNLADGSTSTATLTDIEVDTGLEDSFFSKRYMTR